MVGFKCTYSLKLLRLTCPTLAFETLMLSATSVLGIVLSHAGAVRQEKCFPRAKIVVSVMKPGESDVVSHATQQVTK